MTNLDVDAFAKRMKLYESFETERRLMPLLPVYARIDGHGFHNFTKGMERPFDARLSRAMIETTKYLVKETHARIGYTQSDEISLAWKADEFKSAIYFDGKIQKMVGILASKATAFFTRAILESDLESFATRLPHFDCRVIAFPTETEATNMFLWRTQDATKNAVSMAARHYYSHKALHKKSGAEMQEMLFQKGINFNDYPPVFKRGTFVRRMTEKKPLSDATIAKLQAMGRTVEPDVLHERSFIGELDMPIFSKVTNRENVIFLGDDPILTIDSR